MTLTAHVYGAPKMAEQQVLGARVVSVLDNAALASSSCLEANLRDSRLGLHF